MKKAQRHIEAYVTPESAELVLELWWTKKFDTVQIAQFLDLHESQVCRVIHAGRDMVRMMDKEARG